MSEHVVGIDCAAQPKNIGLALGRLEGPSVRILQVVTGMDDVVPVLTRWAEDFAPRIYTLDAPLGWPSALGDTLGTHRAGQGVEPTSHQLFRRVTDDFVYGRLGKRPLEVGADRIARAAVATLRLLERLRTEIEEPLPLLWLQGVPETPGAIEVYPAATLLARGIPIRGYKGKRHEHLKAREGLLERLAEHLEFAVRGEVLASTDHALDAAVCALAAADFARGCMLDPPARDRAIIRREGWIWFPLPRGDDSSINPPFA